MYKITLDTTSTNLICMLMAFITTIHIAKHSVAGLIIFILGNITAYTKAWSFGLLAYNH